MNIPGQWAVTDSALRKAVERADSLRASLGYIPVGEVNPFAHVGHAQELPYIQTLRKSWRTVRALAHRCMVSAGPSRAVR